MAILFGLSMFANDKTAIKVSEAFLQIPVFQTVQTDNSKEFEPCLLPSLTGHVSIFTIAQRRKADITLGQNNSPPNAV